MPTSKLYVQNFYEPTLSSASVASSGDVTFSLSVTPTYTKGFITFSPSNATQREIMYFDDVVGSTIYVKSENRGLGGTSAKAHTQGETVAMKDVAEIFNFFSNNISNAFYVEKKGGLNVNVWGGSVFYNQAYQSFSDTALTLTANATNYIQYDYPTNTISASLVDGPKTKAVVVTGLTSITSITYQVAKESYVDFVVSLNTALPPQGGNAGKSLITDGTNASWGTNNNYRTGLGAALKQLEVDATGNEVATAVTVGTNIGYTDTIRKRTAGGLYEDIPFSIVEETLNNITYAVAGEDISANDYVYEEKVNTFLASYLTTVPSTNQNIGDVAANTRISMRIIGKGVSASSLLMGLNKTGAPVDNLTVRIETDSSGAPSGSLAHANATSTIAGASLSTGTSEVTVNFAGAFTLTTGQVYHIVLARSGGIDGINYYHTPLYTRRVRAFTTRLYNGSWGAARTTMTFGIVYTGAYGSLVCKTDASYAGTSCYLGFVTSAVLTGALATVHTSGNNKNESGLTQGAAYYLSSTTPGDISTTPGTVVRFVGFAKTSTEMAMIPRENNLSLVDQPTANYTTIWNTTSVFKQWKATAPCTVLVTVVTNAILLLNQTAKTSGVAFDVVPGDVVSFYATGTQTLQVLNKVPQSGFFTI